MAYKLTRRNVAKIVDASEKAQRLIDAGFELVEMVDPTDAQHTAATETVLAAIAVTTDLDNQEAAAAVQATIKALAKTINLTHAVVVGLARRDYDLLTGDQQALVLNSAKLFQAEGTIVKLNIAALSDPITLADAADVAGARTAYDLLETVGIEKVTNYAVLTAAEVAIATLTIAALSDPITAQDAADVAAAREWFDALTTVQQATVENYHVLTEVEIALVVLEITALPAAESVALADDADIIAARASYDALSTAQKPLVENYATLTDAEAAVIALNGEITAAIDAITALPAPESVQLSDESAITAARGLYDALTEEQKALVTNYTTLQAVEAAFALL